MVSARLPSHSCCRRARSASPLTTSPAAPSTSIARRPRSRRQFDHAYFAVQASRGMAPAAAPSTRNAWKRKVAKPMAASAMRWRTQMQRAFGTRAVEEHLVEFGAAGHLPDRAYLDPRLVQRHQQQGEALVAHRAFLAAREDEDPVRFLRPGGPHFLSVDQPFIAGRIAPGAGAHVGKIGAGARLGIALGPVFGTGADAGQEARLLFRRPVVDQRGRQQLLADVTEPPRPTTTYVFFVKDDLPAEIGRAH